MSKTHELKCWPESFVPVFHGIKPFELRKNDRGYEAGDILHLREWEPKMPEHSIRPQLGAGTYTGRECWREVTFVLEGVGPGCILPYKGLAMGYCILGLADVQP